MPMLLSRLLVLIMLLTVLAPGFGWQAAGGVSADPVVVADAHQGHVMPGDDMGDMPCTDCDHHAADEDCVALQHHCCPGHVLGHLAVQQVASLTVLAPGAAALHGQGDPDFASRVPAGLERPPRSFSA